LIPAIFHLLLYSTVTGTIIVLQILFTLNKLFLMEAHLHYALITGAADGEGYGLADLFAKDGFNLEIMAKDHRGLCAVTGEIKQQYGIKVITISKDLFLSPDVFEPYDEVISADIQLDLLVMVQGRIHMVSLLKPVFKKDQRLLN
jgi:short-subunit dehydrogenase